MTFPTPDRSNQVVQRVKTNEDPWLDVGWDEGSFGDGRPWRAEVWAEDGDTFVTFWFSRVGLELATWQDLTDLLSKEGIITWLPGRRVYADAREATDASGAPMWTLGVIVGRAGEPPDVKDSLRLKRYPTPREP